MNGVDPITLEVMDFSCGLLTADGELASMSEDFAGHVFAMAWDSTSPSRSSVTTSTPATCSS